MKSWESNIRKVDPYVPGEQPQTRDITKLNTNENPYPPSPKVMEALKKFDLERFKLYPDYQSTKLVNHLAEYYEVEPEQVFVGVGSDDVLAVAFLAFFNSKKPVLFPNITYSFYKVWAELYQIPYECPTLDENFRIHKEDYYKENGGVVIANPNAPTSLYESVDWIRDILVHNQDSIVIVDEAYIDFAGESALRLTKEFDNLLIVQTYSKSRSMAGMRVGYAIGSKRLIQAMNDVKYSINSYTMNVTSIEMGAAAIEDADYFKETTKKIIATREEAKQRLSELGFDTLDSATNFLFTKHKSMDAVKIFDELRKRNIFVRHFNQPIINQYLRITIGTPEQMQKLYDALEEIL